MENSSYNIQLGYQDGPAVTTCQHVICIGFPTTVKPDFDHLINMANLLEEPQRSNIIEKIEQLQKECQ